MPGQFLVRERSGINTILDICAVMEYDNKSQAVLRQGAVALGGPAEGA